MNCGGDDTVYYLWSLDSNSNDTQMDSVRFMNIGYTWPNGSLTVDADAFLPVVTNESFALVLRGKQML